ncbi:MAG: insulinase family protein [Armatimonadetes bacterium]|nr:insulinase family protein [Armatimonadota bacterium]
MPGAHYSLQLPGGLTLVAEQIPSTRAAAFQFLLPAGATTDPEGHEGAATVLEGLSYRGAGGRTSREFSDALDSLGIQRGGGAELECATFGGALLADSLPEALRLYADLILRPTLPADQFAAEQALALQRLERLEDNPEEKLFVRLRRAYFPGPYGRTALGTEAGLRALTPELIRADHGRRYRPQGGILAVAGRFEWPALRATVEELLQSWEGAPPEQPKPDCSERVRYQHIEQDTNQAQIGVQYPALPLEHPEYYVQRMAIGVLSGGMSARLFTEVREKRGLCYTVMANVITMRGAAAIRGYVATRPETAQEALDVLIAEMVRLADGVSDEELTRARRGLLAALVMQSEATQARAGHLARDQFLLKRVRPLDEIRAGVEAVTAEAIQDHLRRHPARDFTVVTLGPQPVEVKA